MIHRTHGASGHIICSTCMKTYKNISSGTVISTYGVVMPTTMNVPKACRLPLIMERMVNGITISTSPMSSEKRFMIRPEGVASWKAAGARSILCTIWTWSVLEATIPPIAIVKALANSKRPTIIQPSLYIGFTYKQSCFYNPYSNYCSWQLTARCIFNNGREKLKRCDFKL